MTRICFLVLAVLVIVSLPVCADADGPRPRWSDVERREAYAAARPPRPAPVDPAIEHTLSGEAHGLSCTAGALNSESLMDRFLYTDSSVARLFGIELRCVRDGGPVRLNVSQAVVCTDRGANSVLSLADATARAVAFSPAKDGEGWKLFAAVLVLPLPAVAGVFAYADAVFDGRDRALDEAYYARRFSPSILNDGETARGPLYLSRSEEAFPKVAAIKIGFLDLRTGATRFVVVGDTEGCNL